VLTQGLRTTAIGIVAGAAGAALLTRYLQSLPFGVSGHDPLIFTAVIGVLFTVALVACYILSRRATRLDPVSALRSD
jgi:putative ABC transport system permease protein